VKIMPSIPAGSVDIVVTDPPYGIAFKSNGQWFRRAVVMSGDDSTKIAEAIAQAFWGKPLAMFYSPFRSPAIKWRSVLVWNKGRHVGIGGDRETCWKRDFELIGVRDNKPLNGKRDSAILTFRALLHPPSGHFAEKPIDLMVYLIEKLSNPGDTVLDPCMGSGTTGVACVRSGRNFVGIEINKNYFQIAARRIREEQRAMAHGRIVS
jgi:site-specific DNA-methyltransferase (adenine-specific)